jgi:hypothetical protein
MPRRTMPAGDDPERTMTSASRKGVAADHAWHAQDGLARRLPFEKRPVVGNRHHHVGLGTADLALQIGLESRHDRQGQDGRRGAQEHPEYRDGRKDGEAGQQRPKR